MGTTNHESTMGWGGLGRGLPRVDRRQFIGGAAALAAAYAIPEILISRRSSTSATSFATAGNGNSTIYVAQLGDMQNLDPYTTNGDIVTGDILPMLYALPTTDKIPGPDVGGVPSANPNVWSGQAAESWSWNSDQTEITFAIRPGIKFPDGSPLNAQAVKGSWARSFGLQATGYFLFAMSGVTDVSQLDVVDDLHLKMTMPAPSSLLLGNLSTFYSSAIMNPSAISQHATSSDPYATSYFKDNVAGSGQYVLSQWNHGSGWTLSRNPNYWLPVKNKQVVFQIVPDVDQRELLVKSGKVDLALNVPAQDVASLKAEKGLNVITVPTRVTYYAGMNVNRPYFQDKMIRQAISKAVPYDTIMQQVMHGLGVQLKSPIPKGMPDSDFSYWQYKTDYKAAKQLLSKSSAPNGFSTTLSVINGDPQAENSAIWIEEGLQKIGINVAINKMPASAYNAALQDRSLDFFIGSWSSDNNDPFYQLYWLFASSCCTYGRYQTPELTGLINQWVNKPLNDPARVTAAKQAQQMIVEDAPWVFLFQPPAIYVFTDKVKGFVWEPATGTTRYDLLYK